MPGFEEIVGHEQIVTHLKSAMKLGKVSHAYILSGEKGCGKKLLATGNGRCNLDNEGITPESYSSADRAALDALVPLIERTNRWARIENIETATLPLKEHEYGFEERSGD